ncbi:hypothetical protein D9613_006379 [Agrocybe pediades]|uniref:Uncharacterized protein n=1 Tax=Agrocybe pediades TaxID=84607 RepID=A0A8H4VN05_9AGAR|nr:hypothetical protein D9613_011289 [Agrocybe pediades]KAF4617404.1 hypothetical protein D9613_006379 [Agrocybe pediades]
MSTPHHTYPPNQGIDPVIAGLNPQVLAHMESLFSRKMEELGQSYKMSLEAELLQRETEAKRREAALAAEIQSLTLQLELAKIQALNATVDSNLSAPTTTPPPAAKTSATPRKATTPRTPTRRQTTPAPLLQSSPARNTRSSSKQAASTAGNTPVKPSTPTKSAQGNVTPRKGKPVTKPATHIHRVLSSEVPADVGGLQRAMQTHVRILWGLLDPKAIPQDPSPEVLSDFAEHFTSKDSLYKTRRGGPNLVLPWKVKIGSAVANVSIKSRLLDQIRPIEENMLAHIQSILARFGLEIWCPDFRQSPYALYNAALRIVAIDTFKQALISWSYAHLAPNMAYVHDMDLLIKLYDHFVHHHLYSRYKRDARRPGGVLEADLAAPVFQRRTRLAAARHKFAAENGYPPRYLRLIKTKATSDDEADPDDLKIGGRAVYWINRRPERSVEAEVFIRSLDIAREEDVRRDPSRRWKERLRLVRDEGRSKDTFFPALPPSMPIDYYAPEFFNRLQPRLRSKVSDMTIAIPPNPSTAFDRHPDLKLSDAEFQNKYGAEVFSRYELSDLPDADEEEFADDEDDEMYADNSDEDDDFNEDMSAERAELVAHLSEDISMF